MDRIQADYDALSDIASEFDREADLVDTLTRHIGEKVEQLEDGGWIGSGANEFFCEVHDLVFPALQRLSQALCETGLATRMISDMIQSAEEEAACLFTHRQDLGPLPLIGTETELDPFSAAIRHTWAVGPIPPENLLEFTIPEAVDYLRETEAGQDLLAKARAAGICFSLPDGTILGDPNGYEIPIEIDDQLGNEHALYDPGTSARDDDMIILSSDRDQFVFGKEKLAEALSHEMQHALDAQTGLMNSNRGYDPASDTLTLTGDITDMVTLKVATEIRAHERGYAVRDGHPYVDDGVDEDDVRYILEIREYKAYYENMINESLAVEHAADPSRPLRQVHIAPGEGGSIEVIVSTVY